MIKNLKDGQNSVETSAEKSNRLKGAIKQIEQLKKDFNNLMFTNKGNFSTETLLLYQQKMKRAFADYNKRLSDVQSSLAAWQYLTDEVFEEQGIFDAIECAYAEDYGITKVDDDWKNFHQWFLGQWVITKAKRFNN
jgi:hypothetical protein